MTIPEACQLIMQAAVIGEDGETFVLDMGEPVKIRYLAEQMIRLSGREPGREVAIEYTGLRPGEKLYEELFYASEDFGDTPHPKIYVARRLGAMDSAQLRAALDAVRVALRHGDEPGLLALLARVIPEWALAALPGERSPAVAAAGSLGARA
jgi:FlaA1/EpsC-like NDP-sugar epimerase